jgi:hypothetical protein
MRLAWLLVLLLACTHTEETTPTTPPPVEEVCPPGTKPVDGACLAPGVPEGECAPGFVWDQQGCVPVLPAEACARGTMAVPGETTCHEVSPCASGKWGDIPIDGATQHVDANYAGTDSDGSAQRPWRLISDAVNAAEPSAIIALAAGTYAGIRLNDKPVRLWGVCPALVTVATTVAGAPSVDVRADGDGSEIRSLALGGAGYGFAAAGVQNVLVERVWVRDTASAGVLVDNGFGPTAITLRGCLVEHAAFAGVALQGATAVVESSVVRDTVTSATGDGRGVSAVHRYGSRANLTVTKSLVERNTDSGIYVWSSDATVEATLVRDTRAIGPDAGFGIAAGASDDQRSTVAVKGSVLDWNRSAGLVVVSSDAAVETTVVRDMLTAEGGPRAGRGFAAYNVPGATSPATLTLKKSLAERTIEHGIHAIGSDVTIEQTLVRWIGPRPYDQRGGRGIGVEDDDAGTARSHLALRWSVVEQTLEGGVLSVGSDAEIEASRVTATQPSQLDAALGDGLVVVASYVGPEASALITNSLIETSTRAGIASFGGTLTLSSTTFECNTIHLDGETFAMRPYNFTDGGNNTCGCADQPVTCAVLSSNLTPPDPL